MSTLPFVRNFPYVSLVRVPLVVDALLLLVHLPSQAVSETLAGLVAIAFVATLPLELWVVSRSLWLLTREPSWRTWRHGLAIACGTAQAGLVWLQMWQIARAVDL